MIVTSRTRRAAAPPGFDVAARERPHDGEHATRHLALAGLAASLRTLALRPPIRVTEILHARLAVRLTLVNGGIGRYGRVWGRWSLAWLTPSLGTTARLPVRGVRDALPEGGRLCDRDALTVLPQLGRPRQRRPRGQLPYPRAPSRDRCRWAVWPSATWCCSTTCATARTTGATSRSSSTYGRWAVPLRSYPPYQAILGWHTLAHPVPPDGLAPLHRAWEEITMRDPPLRASPAGPALHPLYLGHLVRLLAVERAPGSRTGWLEVASGPLHGWVNGDWVTRLAGAPAYAQSALAGVGEGDAHRSPAPLPVRGAFGHRLYVDTLGCPTPAWAGHPCAAPFVLRRRARYPMDTVTALRPLDLTLNPVAGSVAVERLPVGRPLAAQRVGAFAARFGAGGRADGVL